MTSNAEVPNQAATAQENEADTTLTPTKVESAGIKLQDGKAIVKDTQTGEENSVDQTKQQNSNADNQVNGTQEGKQDQNKDNYDDGKPGPSNVNASGKEGEQQGEQEFGTEVLLGPPLSEDEEDDWQEEEDELSDESDDQAYLDDEKDEDYDEEDAGEDDQQDVAGPSSAGPSSKKRKRAQDESEQDDEEEGYDHC